MRYEISDRQCKDFDLVTRREWVLPNGLGGYAMGTASGINTRRYHGHLIASTNPPTGRMLLLAAIDAFVKSGSGTFGISSNQYPGAVHPEGHSYLKAFTVDDSTAVWTYKTASFSIQKRLSVHQGRNAVSVEYQNCGKTTVSLVLRPLVCHRDHHSEFSESSTYPQQVLYGESRTTISHGDVSLVIDHPGSHRDPVQGWNYRFEHARETDRGLPSRDDLFCPCELTYELRPGMNATLVASLDGEADAVTEPTADVTGESITDQLRSAASKFIVKTEKRTSILAGYPWFTDWGRDTMISLPGICLHTGRVVEARQILRDYASQLQQGLIPNRFVEAGETPDYNTVDATLWFANAIYKTLQAQWHTGFAQHMADVLDQVYLWHLKGTQYGIQVDPTDGLLRQGEEGCQLTWMDAKVGDWVVTPRHGKPVEISALWINALRIMEWLAKELESNGQAPIRGPEAYAASASLAEQNFERKFWLEKRHHYADTCDPIDASLRPNQVLAMCLPFSPVSRDHARQALAVVRDQLLTPVGLRTLGPDEANYRGRFRGPLAELDAAYHQGTVWPWLLGPFVTATCKYGGTAEEGKLILRNVTTMLVECGIAGISEVYDGDPPHSPGGCPWQAWSVAEILRAWVEDCGG